jgi:hypothetical protein
MHASTPITTPHRYQVILTAGAYASAGRPAKKPHQVGAVGCDSSLTRYDVLHSVDRQPLALPRAELSTPWPDVRPHGSRSRAELGTPWPDVRPHGSRSRAELGMP